MGGDGRQSIYTVLVFGLAKTKYKYLYHYELQKSIDGG